jgi:hypothetical protein
MAPDLRVRAHLPRQAEGIAGQRLKKLRLEQ